MNPLLIGCLEQSCARLVELTEGQAYGAAVLLWFSTETGNEYSAVWNAAAVLLAEGYAKARREHKDMGPYQQTLYAYNLAIAEAKRVGT